MGEREENKRKSTDFRRPNVGFWQFWHWAQPATKNGITNKQPNVTQCGYSTAKVGIQPTIGIQHDLSRDSGHLKQFLWIFSTIFSNHGGRRQLHDKMQTKIACFQDLLQAWLPNPELFDHYLKLL
jgi:hypothetical protein